MKDLREVLRNDSLTHSSPMSTITSRLGVSWRPLLSQHSRPQATVVITDVRITLRFATFPPQPCAYRKPSSVNCSICTTIKFGHLARLKYGATFHLFCMACATCHRQDINKADVISFGQIPYFLHEIGIANPGPTTYVAATSEEAIPEIKQPEVVIVHDWEKGLQQAQRQVLAFPFESIWFGTLKKNNVNTIFKSKFGGQIWAAAKAGQSNQTQ
ncbi:hypothetical protein BASA61_008146 [Batrachochytrium salamandrivorans]|nr:hypothetical protein BASA61_008146 [Batrachochytrium salamandrivorans]